MSSFTQLGAKYMKSFSKQDSFTFIGGINPAIVMYLPNPPQCCQPFAPQKPNVSGLIAENGNHWRKILTIFAKLVCVDNDWKKYRDEQLLQGKEQLCFNYLLQSGVDWHLIAGKATWQQMGYDCEQFRALDDKQTAFVKDNILLLPYPDYRQFPNKLIDVVKSVMQGPCS